MSQFQCGRSASQHGYPSSAWCAVTVTNYLMGREPSLKRISPLTPLRCRSVVLRGISIDFSMLSPSSGPVAHALLTRPPLSLIDCPKTLVQAPFDLHVLSAPPAFVLSQDQTLNLEFDSSSPTFPFPGRSFACVFLVSHPESTVFLSLCLWHFRASTTLRSSLPLYSFQGSLLPHFIRAT